MSSSHGPGLRPRQHQISLRGCTLAYREAGEGQPVLFVHGTLAGMDTFRRQLQWFGHRARAVAYSRRFHPPSGPMTGGVSEGVSAGGTGGPLYRLDDHASDLVSFVRALGLTRPHLVGSSYGAYVAIRACLMEPELAASLVAAEPPMLRLLELTPEGRSELRTFQESVLGPAREAFAHGDINTGVTHFFDGIRGQPGAFASLSPLQQADLLKYGQELLLELTSDFDQYMPSISLEELHAVRVPTLLLSGGTSPRLFHLITGMLHPAIPGAGLVTISAADHSIHTSAPAVYNETVWEFIMTRF